MTAETWTQEDMREYIRSGQAPVRSKSVQRRVGRIEFTLPTPPYALHPNSRCCWRAKIKPRKGARAGAYVLALLAVNQQPPKWQVAEVQTTWYITRRNDGDNLIAWCKTYFDGIASALGMNDSSFIHMPPKQITGKAASGRREVVFEITERA